jgi:hypothetical protein
MNTYVVTYEHRKYSIYTATVKAENQQEAEHIALTDRIHGFDYGHKHVESGDFMDDPYIVLETDLVDLSPDLLAQSIENLEQTLAQLKSLTVRPKTKS